MAVLYMDKNADNADRWLRELRGNLGEYDIRRWPEEVGDRSEIEVAVVGLPERGELENYPNLKAILSTWAGVDRLMADGMVPRDVPLGRLVDQSLRADMTLFVLHWVLHFHREIHLYRELQLKARWQLLPYRETAERGVGIMGLGALGSDAAEKVTGLGFAVAGWDAVAKDVAGVTSFVGADQLHAFLERTEILVSLLPLTPETEGILNARTLAALPRGACLVSCARGAHIVDDDLIAALDDGQIGAAALDAFSQEPLSTDHPFWRHPRVYLTPHAAAKTNPRTAAQEIAEDVRRVLDGLPPRHPVDMKLGY